MKVDNMQEGNDLDKTIRRLLWAIPNGLFLIGSSSGVRKNLMTASFVTQISTQPRIVLVSVETDSVTASLLSESKKFTLSCLTEANREAVRKFAKPAVIDTDGNYSGFEVIDSHYLKLPVLASAVSYLELNIVRFEKFGSHIAFFGEILNGKWLKEEVPKYLEIHDTRMRYGG